MKVHQIMTHSVACIAAHDTIQDAARKMKTCDVGDLPVIIDHEAVGMVTDRDIVLRTVALGLDPQKTEVTEAMTKGVVVCKEDDDLEIVARMMASCQVRQLPVINAKRRLSGIVSLGDLVHQLEPGKAAEILKSILQKDSSEKRTADVL